MKKELRNLLAEMPYTRISIAIGENLRKTRKGPNELRVKDILFFAHLSKFYVIDGINKLINMKVLKSNEQGISNETNIMADEGFCFTKLGIRRTHTTGDQNHDSKTSAPDGV